MKMETLKLNSDGKVVIPGLGTGKKKITIKQLEDKISHIPDTDSIEVDIDSKQGLLPPERVTSNNEYPFNTTINANTNMCLVSVPQYCNGFIPNYIDTTNLNPGDKVYIIDPHHKDTSKYVLNENKQWIYSGNYNDPEIGGVDGVDYSPVVSHQGGCWIIRNNPQNDEQIHSVKIGRKTDIYFGKWKIIEQALINEGDMCFGQFSCGK